MYFSDPELPRLIRRVVWAIGAAIFLLGAIVGLVAVAAIRSALAHSWYDFACCNENDCALYRGAVQITDDAYVLDTGERVAREGDDRKKRSLDHQFHVCRRPDGSLRCLYVPGGGGA